MSPNPLAGFSKSQLLEELARREKRSNERKPIDHFCEDCRYFKFCDRDMPDDHNCCTKGHKMSFRMPEGYDFTDYGFYRRVCPDRAPREEVPDDNVNKFGHLGWEKKLT